MGLFVSCLRSRPKREQEREPLLSTIEEQRQPELKYIFKKLVHIVAALDAGKLPSQHQLNRLIKVVLKSHVLHPKRGGPSPASIKVLRDLREVLGLLAVFGLENNYDDKIQEIIFHVHCLASTPPEPDELIVLEPPTELDPILQHTCLLTSELQTDIPLIFSSLYSLLSLFLTSTSFRIVSDNLFLLVRQYLVSSLVEGVQKVERVAEGVESAVEMVQDLTDRAVHMASQVQGVAEGLKLSAMDVGSVAKDIERVVLSSNNEADAMHGLESLKARVQEVTQRGEGQARQKEHVGPQQGMKGSKLDYENFDKAFQHMELVADRAQAEERKDAIIESIQQILLEIHHHPSQMSALRTILSLARKYVGHYRTLCALRYKESGSSPNLIPESNTSQWKHLTSLSINFKTLFERFTGNGNQGRSLDPLMRAFRDVAVLPMNEFGQNEGTSDFTSQIMDRTESGVLVDLATYVNHIADSALGTGSSRRSDSEQMVYIASDLFRREVRTLDDKMRKIRRKSNYSSPSSPSDSSLVLTPKLYTLKLEFEAFLTALHANRTSQRLAHSLITLGRDCERYIHPLSEGDLKSKHSPKATNIPSVLTTVLNDLIGYLVPKIVGGVMESLFGPSNVRLPQYTMDSTYDSMANPIHSKRTRKEWRFPLPLPRVELVSDINTSLSSPSSSSSGSRTESRSLEVALDPRLMHIRILNDKEVESRWEENRFTTCFHWCCCSSPSSDIVDQYVDAEEGCAAPYSIHTTEPEREPAVGQTDLADLLTPSSISITQWNETRVELFSSSLVQPETVVDAEPLLVDLSVSAQNTKCEADVRQVPTLIDFDVGTNSTSHAAVLPFLDPTSDEYLYNSDEQSDRLVAVVQNGDRIQRGGGTKTKIKTKHKIRVHIEGLLSSLPGDTPDNTSVASPNKTSLLHPFPSVKSKITRRLTIENIGYYARYNFLSSVFGTWLGIQDEGLLDVEFEFRDSNTSIANGADNNGALLDIEIDLDSHPGLNNLSDFYDSEDESDPEADLPFKVSNTHFVLPHTLDITPRLRVLPSSTLLSTITTLPRRIFLALLLRPAVPLAKFMIRRELQNAITQGIEQGCDFAGRLMVKVSKGAKRRARKRAAKIKSEADALITESKVGTTHVHVAFGDVWSSMMETLREMTAVQEPGVIVHTKLKEVSVKGAQVERTTAEPHQQDQGAPGGEETDAIATNTTTISIGIEPQLLPDKTDLVSSTLPLTDSTEVVDDVIAIAARKAFDKAGENVKDGLEQDFEDVVERSQDVVQKVAEVAEGMREGIDEVRQGVNQSDQDLRLGEGEGGWRSIAFNV